MLDEYIDEQPTSPLEFFHFALGFVGFIVAVSGVVISSVGTALLGLFLFCWALAFFFAQPK